MQLFEPGQIFAERYRIERLLAEGGMGAVFIAEQIATEMRVAVKVLWPQMLQSSVAVEKFEAEAKVAARVNSDHIVKVFDAGVDASTKFPFLVMELLQGVTLQALVENSGRQSAAATVEFIRQVAIGLDKAHNYVDREGKRRSIIHRDLKPENIFLTRRDSGEPVIKILDFGIAKFVGQTTAVSREIRGTPLYMASEQAMGIAVSERTDVWALGLITYFLLSGSSYWRTATNPDAGITALLAEVLSLPLVSPTQRFREGGRDAPPWPPAFDEWFRRCVNRDVEARFTSAGDAAKALSMALLNQELSMPAIAITPGPHSDAGSRNDVALAPTSLSNPGYVVANFPTGDPLMTADRIALVRTNDRPKPARSVALIGSLATAILIALVVGTYFGMRAVDSPTAPVDSVAAQPEPSSAVFAASSASPVASSRSPDLVVVGEEPAGGPSNPASAPDQPTSVRPPASPPKTPAPDSTKPSTPGPVATATRPAPTGTKSPPPPKETVYGER